MAQTLSANLEKLLQDLRAREPYLRKTAAEELGKSNTTDERVLSALNAVIAADDNKYVRRAAADTYFTLTGKRSPEEIIEQEPIDAKAFHSPQGTTLAEKARRNKRLLVMIAGIVAAILGLWAFAVLTRPEIRTSTDTLVITKARFTDRVPPGCTSSSLTCIAAEPGYRILLVWMKPKSGENEPVIPRGAYVVADNGTQAEWFHQQTNVSPPWVQLAFAVKDADRNFQLVMPDNASVNLNSLLYLLP